MLRALDKDVARTIISRLGEVYEVAQSADTPCTACRYEKKMLEYSEKLYRYTCLKKLIYYAEKRMKIHGVYAEVPYRLDMIDNDIFVLGEWLKKYGPCPACKKKYQPHKHQSPGAGKEQNGHCEHPAGSGESRIREQYKSSRDCY